MKLKYIFINTILFVLLASTSFAAYDDPGTDYSNKSSDKWIQDRAGDGLRMVNSFVCIFKNANGYTRPNTTWKVLIDEVKCGLQDASEAGSGAVSYATATIVSTRANDTSNQEMKAYFEAANADKYVSTLSLNSSTESIYDLLMDFRWYQVTSDNASGTHSGNPNGWSEITIGDNNSDGSNDTIVRHTDYGPPQGADPAYELGVAAVTYGPDNNVTKFVSKNQDYELNTTVLYQGVTDANRYRRKTIRTSDNVTLDTSCYDRSKQWANTYDYNLYDNITGAEIKISGSFGFTYDNASKRGYMGHWGVHMDGGNADYPSGSSTVSIVQEDTNDNMTLYAAPGKLTKITQESITIAEGEKFRIWAGNGEKDIYYLSTCGTSKFTTADDGTCSEFNFPNTYWKVQSGGSNLISSGDWLYSEMNRAQVMLGTVPAATMFKRDKVTPQSTAPSLAADLALTCVGWCPKSRPSKTEREQYAYENFCQAPFDQNYNDGQGDPGDSSGCTYTFKNRDDTSAPLTMMRGADPVVLVKNDNTTPMTKADADQGRNYHIGGGRYILTSDIGGTCAAVEDPNATNNIWNCAGGVFEWSTGIERWDQYYYAKYDNSSYVTIETPVRLDYTFAATDDQNNTAFPDSTTTFSYIWKKDNVDGNGYRDGTGYTNTAKTAYPAQFNGKSFILQYEGQGNLQGLPDRRTDNNWLKLINPKSGTQVTDADNSSKGYVLKAVGTGMMLANHADATACDNMTFDFSTADLPDYTDKALPSFAFSTKPEVETISVQHGVEQE